MNQWFTVILQSQWRMVEPEIGLILFTKKIFRWM
nr:MAG TPA: hypothetical protein [Caudoviricetes sp.]